jgi:hypothetical protein
MSLVFEEAHAAPNPKRVNEEYFVLANTGASPVSTRGLAVVVARPGKRGEVLGQIDPGFTLQPGERILIVTGIPGKPSLGEPPRREGMRVYHMRSREPLLRGSGSVVRFALNQVDVAKLTYDKDAPGGIARS